MAQEYQVTPELGVRLRPRERSRKSVILPLRNGSLTVIPAYPRRAGCRRSGSPSSRRTIASRAAGSGSQPPIAPIGLRRSRSRFQGTPPTSPDHNPVASAVRRVHGLVACRVLRPHADGEAADLRPREQCPALSCRSHRRDLGMTQRSHRQASRPSTGRCSVGPARCHRLHSRRTSNGWPAGTRRSITRSSIWGRCVCRSMERGTPRFGTQPQRVRPIPVVRQPPRGWHGQFTAVREVDADVRTRIAAAAAVHGPDLLADGWVH